MFPRERKNGEKTSNDELLHRSCFKATQTEDNKTTTKSFYELKKEKKKKKTIEALVVFCSYILFNSSSACVHCIDFLQRFRQQ